MKSMPYEASYSANQRGLGHPSSTITDEQNLPASLDLELKRQPLSQSKIKLCAADLMESVWAEASLTPFISTGDTMSKCTCISQGPVCNSIRFQHFLATSKIRG